MQVNWLEILLGALLGIVTSYLFTLYQERRSQEKLIFLRSVKSRFDVRQVDKVLAKQLSISYKNNSINSIVLFKLKITNSSRKSIANQVFTVSFSEDAQLIDERLNASKEISTFISKDLEIISNNETRYIVGLLPRKAELEFEFVVINHEGKTFSLDSGMLPPNDKRAVAGFQTSVDVDVVITDFNFVESLDVKIARLTKLALAATLLSLFQSIHFFPGSVFDNLFDNFLIVAQSFSIVLFFTELRFIIPKLLEIWISKGVGSNHIAFNGDVKVDNGSFIATNTLEGSNIETTPRQIETMPTKALIEHEVLRNQR